MYVASLLLPFSFELFRLKPVLVLTNLKGQVPKLWNCPSAIATESSSVIHESVGNPSSKLPRGVRRGSTTGLQGMERMSLGGELVLVSACLTVTPPITRGQEHTHTPATCAAGQVTTIVRKAKLTPALLVRAVPIGTLNGQNT
jgi:hypothetical protein